MLAIQFQFSIYPSNRGKYSLLASNRTIRLMIPRHGIQIYRVPSARGLVVRSEANCTQILYRCRYVRKITW